MTMPTRGDPFLRRSEPPKPQSTEKMSVAVR